MHYGAGIYMEESSPMLKNLIIKNNTTGGTSRSRGGGIYCLESTPNLNNVLIEDNEVFSYQRAYGGGIACEDDSYMYLNNVTIKNNEVWNGTRNLGGGIYITDSSAELYNVVITDNSIWGGSSNDGAGIYCNSSSLNMCNSTIVNNNVLDGTMYETGGLYSMFYSQLNLINCILWNNLPLNIHCIRDTAIVNYSNIQGGWEGAGNIDMDPLFMDILNGDYNLTGNSPCIDAGDPAFPFDPDGTIADMGAFYFEQIVEITNEELQISNFELFNYPNPFNPTTTISFSISDDSKIELSIFNIKGQKVKELLNDQITAGEHSIIWNGEDVSGKKVGSGVYLYKLKINDKTEIVKKCMLLK